MTKNNKKNSKFPVLKTVGIVFMIITLLVALLLTNDTVKQFIIESWAFSPRCARIGSPSARQRCDAEERWDAEAAAIKKPELNYWYNLVKKGQINLWEYREAIRAVLARPTH